MLWLLLARPGGGRRGWRSLMPGTACGARCCWSPRRPGTRAWSRRAAAATPLPPVLYGWIGLDDAALLFLAITSVIFLAAALLRGGLPALGKAARCRTGPRKTSPFDNYPEADLHRLPAAVPGDDDAGGRQPALGPDVGRGRGHDAGQRAADLLPSPPASLEATWKYLVICSVGIALALLGNFFLAVAARVGPHGTLSPDARPTWKPHARQLDPRVAEGGVPAAAGRLRDEDGPGPAAHLAARRPQRSPLDGLGAALRRPAELRLPGRSSADTACWSTAGLARVQPGTAGAVRTDLDGRGGRVHHRPDGLQTAAGLFQRRAHGHPVLGVGIGGVGRLRQPCSTPSITR